MSEYEALKLVGLVLASRGDEDDSRAQSGKMEAGDPSVSIDLLVKPLLALGVSKKELGRHTILTQCSIDSLSTR